MLSGSIVHREIPVLGESLFPEGVSGKAVGCKDRGVPEA